MAEHGYDKERLPRFGHIPRFKFELPPLALKFAKKRSIALVTEGLGKRRFHGRVVILVNEHSTGTAEMLAQFALEWFVEQLRVYTQRQLRGARTPECPDDSFLREYAAKPGSFSLSGPRVQHVTSCGHCLPALLDFRSAVAVRRPVPVRLAAIAAMCAACLIVGFVVAKYWNRQNPLASNPPAGQRASAVVDRILDLTNYGTFRGAEEQPRQSRHSISPRPCFMSI